MATPFIQAQCEIQTAFKIVTQVEMSTNARPNS